MYKVDGIGSLVECRRISSITGQHIPAGKSKIKRIFRNDAYKLPDGSEISVRCYELESGLIVAAQDVLLRPVTLR